MSLAWPAEAFLVDPAVRIALAQKRYDFVAFAVLFASASWVSETGMLPSNPERLAAILGMDLEITTAALQYWADEGKVKTEPNLVYFPWVTRLKAESESAAAARSEQASVAARARHSAPPPGAQTSIVPAASDEHADGSEWPKGNEATKRLCDIWNARFGSGAAPGDLIAFNAGRLRKGGAPWDAVVRSFTRYVETVENAYASPAAWRKRWRAYDPEEPEHDPEAAAIADSWDRQIRQRRGGGMKPVGDALRGLEGGKK